MAKTLKDFNNEDNEGIGKSLMALKRIMNIKMTMRMRRAKKMQLLYMALILN